MNSQQKVWNAIAPEWHEFKKIPSELSKKFLKKCSGKVLDLGSGSGRHLLESSSLDNNLPAPKALMGGRERDSQTKRKMYLVDFSKEMLKLAEQRAKKKKIPAEFIQADLTKLPFKDNFFDSAISISAIHCLKPKDHKKAIKELYRVMKPKSKALIGVWNFHSKRFNQKQGKEKLIRWQEKGKRYYYLFDEKEIHDLFKQAGFKIISTHNTEMMLNFVVIK